jgi:hypothetical protein
MDVHLNMEMENRYPMHSVTSGSKSATVAPTRVPPQETLSHYCTVYEDVL